MNLEGEDGYSVLTCVFLKILPAAHFRGRHILIEQLLNFPLNQIDFLAPKKLLSAN